METRHFELSHFTLECGVTLPRATLAYATLGSLNAARSNAVLLPSWYGADLHGYDSLIGPGRAVDPDQLYWLLWPIRYLLKDSGLQVIAFGSKSEKRGAWTGSSSQHKPGHRLQHLPIFAGSE